MMKKNLIPTALVLLAPLLWSGQANAIKCTLSQDCVIAIDRAKSSINSNIDQMDSNIAREVDKARVDIINALGRQTSSLSGQTAQAVETQTRHAEEVVKANRKIDAIRNRSQTGCGSAASGQGPIGGGYKPGGSERDSANSSVPPRLKKAWDQSDPNAPILPPADTNVSRVDLGVGSCQGFAGDPNSMRGQLCRSVQGLQIKSNKYADADIRAETLFDGPQEKGAEELKLTVTSQPNTPERDARKAIVQQYSDPISPPGISASAASTSEGVAYIGALSSYNAIASLSSKPTRDWDLMTSASRSTLGALDVLVNDQTTSKFVTEHLKESFPNWSSEGISPVELMFLEVEKRVGNPDWFTYMAGADDVQKAAEVPYILAYQSRMMFQQLQETRRLNVLLGQLLMLQAKEVMLPELTDLARRANRLPARFDNEREPNSNQD